MLNTVSLLSFIALAVQASPLVARSGLGFNSSVTTTTSSSSTFSSSFPSFPNSKLHNSTTSIAPLITAIESVVSQIGSELSSATSQDGFGITVGQPVFTPVRSVVSPAGPAVSSQDSSQISVAQPIITSIAQEFQQVSEINGAAQETSPPPGLITSQAALVAFVTASSPVAPIQTAAAATVDSEAVASVVAGASSAVGLVVSELSSMIEFSVPVTTSMLKSAPLASLTSSESRIPALATPAAQSVGTHAKSLISQVNKNSGSVPPAVAASIPAPQPDAMNATDCEAVMRTLDAQLQTAVQRANGTWNSTSNLPFQGSSGGAFVVKGSEVQLVKMGDGLGFQVLHAASACDVGGVPNNSTLADRGIIGALWWILSGW